MCSIFVTYDQVRSVTLIIELVLNTGKNKELKLLTSILICLLMTYINRNN
jgi:hypothetical protein